MQYAVCSNLLFILLLMHSPTCGFQAPLATKFTPPLHKFPAAAELSNWWSPTNSRKSISFKSTVASVSSLHGTTSTSFGSNNSWRNPSPNSESSISRRLRTPPVYTTRLTSIMASNTIQDGAAATPTSATTTTLKAGNSNSNCNTHEVRHYYRTPGVLPATVTFLLRKAQDSCPDSGIESIATEHCFNVEVSKATPLDADQEAILEWLLRETFEPDQMSTTSFLSAGGVGNDESNEKNTRRSCLLEVGPRLSFESAVSSNAKSICRACGLDGITRLEVSRRYLVTSTRSLGDTERPRLVSMLHDRMTEMEYPEPIRTFHTGEEADPVVVVPILAEGRKALEAINATRGLGFDLWDLEFYETLFKEKLKRDPTDVELFDMGQARDLGCTKMIANSEHSRHWFFSGKMLIDGEHKEKTLFKLVKDTLSKGPKSNSIIAFHDNSSAIRGPSCPVALPSEPGRPCAIKPLERILHPILTAETHNFPSGVAPFPGAETGTGGRLRDVMATGRGAKPIAGISSYCVGNLRIPGYSLPWEEEKGAGEWEYASNLASPLEIEIQASNGASDYGNKFGEPVIHGFTRSFGQRLPEGERFEYVKPIMFSAGIGQMDDAHADKGEPEVGMWVVKVGGPAYRIGLGGGAASSRVGDANTARLDFNAVQRGDAEMENRLNRLMRACVELGEANPIVSLHDQGAGGNGNVLKEIVDPAGATYDIRKVLVGDETMSVLEIWGAEYQENNALLIRPESREVFLAMADREKCPASLIGQVSGDGRVTVRDSRDGSVPYDLPLKEVLGDLPQKTFSDTSSATKTKPLEVPATAGQALERVLRLLQVGSKRFLTNKVDRSVTGLVAQQQCVGPLQTPLADCGVVASSHLATTGIATACGEQPIKGLLDPAAMARLTVAESLTNIMWAKLTSMEDIKASGNWMYAAKLPGECAKMWKACVALRQALLDCGVGIDGGKDSLSMAARCGDELVKSPGTLVMTLYCTCPDITKTVTPDLKLKGTGRLLYVDLGAGEARLGGTCLAQVYGQVGQTTPDVEDFGPLVAAFKATQGLLDSRAISAGHDRSDGGLITALLEMAFAGEVGCGLDVDIDIPPSAAIAATDTDSGGGGGAGTVDLSIATLFAEEVGFVVEVAEDRRSEVMEAYRAAGVKVVDIGKVTDDGQVVVRVGGEEAVRGTTAELRTVWEATSFQLERLQCNPLCVEQEASPFIYLILGSEASMATRTGPDYKLTFVPEPSPQAWKESGVGGVKRPKAKVCVLREEGSNGDREMLSAFHEAGLEAWDVNTHDLLQGTVTLEDFRGVVFVGGFSYGDVLDSGKGWAATIKYNKKLWEQFESFKARKDTFSLGVCNGCQLMALLGWVPKSAGFQDEKLQPRFVHNESGRFESRWTTVKLVKSPSVLLTDMEGSSLGVWVAHGEGRALFPDADSTRSREWVLEQGLAPVRYVDDSNNPTEAYPFNPNGSPDGIAALCSEDGRHLAMMPHPERCFLTWQWPYMPKEWRNTLAASPWLKMFQNARQWCDENPRHV
ncbi:unnamed protein product [Ascophyllum nodosum]